MSCCWLVINLFEIVKGVVFIFVLIKILVLIVFFVLWVFFDVFFFMVVIFVVWGVMMIVVVFVVSREVECGNGSVVINVVEEIMNVMCF